MNTNEHCFGEIEKKPTVAETVYDWIEAAVVALVTVVVLFTFVFRVVGVNGSSMFPNLETDDRLVLRCIAYTPERGDIVVINRYVEDPLVKRVIAVAGDTLNITAEGQVVLNGVVLDEEYLPFDLATPRKQFEGPVRIPEGCIFVMGDNRTDSHDSRYTDIGFVSLNDVVGKAIWRLWPINKFGPLT